MLFLQRTKLSARGGPKDENAYRVGHSLAGVGGDGGRSCGKTVLPGLSIRECVLRHVLTVEEQAEGLRMWKKFILYHYGRPIRPGPSPGLAACKTAMCRMRAEEGVIGVQLALMLAGADTVVLPRREVPSAV